MDCTKIPREPTHCIHTGDTSVRPEVFLAHKEIAQDLLHVHSSQETAYILILLRFSHSTQETLYSFCYALHTTQRAPH